MKYSRIILFLLGISFLFTGCIKEDLSECPVSLFFVAKAYDMQNRELADKEVKDVILYVFDQDLRFVSAINAKVNERVEIETSRNKQIHVYAWGNLSGGNEQMPVFKVGDSLDKGHVSLVRSADNLTYLSPDDLFEGKVEASSNEESGDKIIPMYRRTGSLLITVRHLKEFTGIDDNDYEIYVDASCNEVDFEENSFGNKAVYKPSVQPVNGGHEFVTPQFNLFSETKGVVIKIYHHETLVASVSTYHRNDPILIEPGVLTNVLIDFKQGFIADLSITPWGEKYIWKTFP